MPAFCETAASVKVEHLGVMLRVHDRAGYLHRVIGDACRLGRGRKLTITIGADRPTREVLKVLATQLHLVNNAKGRFLNVHSLPPLPHATHSRWMEPLLVLHERHRADIEASKHGPVQAGMLLDDDAVFTRDGLKEIRGHLTSLDYDRLDVEHKFLWNNAAWYNAAVPTHWSAAVWRQYENDDFPTSFVVRCPERVARSSRVHRLHHKALEFGWLREEDRDRAFQKAKLAGRLDAHTLALVRPPNLKSVDGCQT
jgi:hypothetical protein